MTFVSHQKADVPRSYHDKARVICEHLQPADMHSDYNEGALHYLCHCIKGNPDHLFDSEPQQGLIDQLYPIVQQKMDVQ